VWWSLPTGALSQNWFPRKRSIEVRGASSTVSWHPARSRPPVEDGDALEGCPVIRLPRGMATTLIDSDRGEA